MHSTASNFVLPGSFVKPVDGLNHDSELNQAQEDEDDGCDEPDLDGSQRFGCEWTTEQKNLSKAGPFSKESRVLTSLP